MRVVEHRQAIRNIQIGIAVYFHPIHSLNAPTSCDDPFHFRACSYRDDLNEVFKLRYLAFASAGNGRLVDIWRLAIDPNISNTSYRTTKNASMFRSRLIASEAGHATDILVATKPESIRFCGPILGCEQIGQPRNYPPFNLEITFLSVTMSQAETPQRKCGNFFRTSIAEIDWMRAAIKKIMCSIASGTNDPRTAFEYDRGGVAEF